MIRTSTPRAAVVAVASLSALGLGATSALAGPASEAVIGPSTTVAPYVLPVASGVTITSHLTVGDEPTSNGYRMAGIPDGIGTLAAAGGNVDVLMNHELRQNQGIVRDHGEIGAFVSRMTIDPATGEVVSGDDFIKDVTYWQYAYGTPGGTYAAAPTAPFLPQLGRFCSGALTDPGQLLDEQSGNGYDGQIYFANEETDDNGRAFGVTADDGVAHQLPRLGLFAWENTLAAPNTSDTTLVMGNEDSATGQLRAYVGTKTTSTSPVEAAGLTNGQLTVIDLVNEAVSTDAQYRTTYGKGTAVPVELSPVDWNQTGATQNAQAAAAGLTLNRIEDGSFDPRNPDDYYFLTTEGGSGANVPTGTTGRDGGGLWKLSFADIEQPQLGGTLTLLLDGSEEPYLNKPDNMTIDDKGNLLIQEDPGNNVHLARIVAYRIADGARGVVAQFDPARFGAPAAGTPAFLTQDEESSGIVASGLLGGKGVYVFDAQVHRASDSPAPFNVEEVEEGQLLTMTVQSWGQVYRITG